MDASIMLRLLRNRISFDGSREIAEIYNNTHTHTHRAPGCRIELVWEGELSCNIEFFNFLFHPPTLFYISYLFLFWKKYLWTPVFEKEAFIFGAIFPHGKAFFFSFFFWLVFVSFVRPVRLREHEIFNYYLWHVPFRKKSSFEWIWGQLLYNI